jgi:hypothetical protein
MRKALFLLVLVVGCGGGGGDDDVSSPDAAAPDAVVPDASTSDLTVAEAFEESVRITCEKAHECRDSFPGQPADFEAEFGTTVDACIAMLSTDTQQAEYEASVAAGRIVFDPQDAAVCLASFEDITCTELWNGADFAPECETTFVGQVPDGQACTIDDDCANDTSSCDVTCMPV